MRKRDFKNQEHHVCNCSQTFDNNMSVQPNLALTPYDVKKLTERGISVSTQQLAVVNDAESAGLLPLEQQRGVDINVVWEQSIIAKETIGKAYKSLKNKDI